MADSLNMSFGENGLRMLQDFEKFSAKMYDNDGGGHCTIGWGHLVHEGLCDGRENEKQFESGVTREQGDAILKQDLGRAEGFVNRHLTELGASPTQNQFDALVSFAYNAGTGNLERMLAGCVGPDAKLDLSKVPVRLKLYNRSSGKVLAGLTRRREREAELFQK